MAKLQMLLEELLENLGANNPELPVAVNFNIEELRKISKKESKKQLSSCMALIDREEKVIEGKIYRIQLAISNLEKKDRLNFKKTSENQNTKDLKMKLSSLEIQKKELHDLWEKMNTELVRLDATYAATK